MKTVRGTWWSTNEFFTDTGEKLYVAAYGMTRDKYRLPIDCYLLLDGYVIIEILIEDF